MNKLNNNRGISLLEVLLSLFLLSIMSLAFAGMMKNQTVFSVKIENKFDANELRDDIQKIIDHEETCTLNFAGLTSGSTISEIITSREDEEIVLYALGDGLRKVEITQMSIASIEASAGNEKVTFQLSLEAHVGQHTYTLNKETVFYATVNDDNEIIECGEGANNANGNGIGNANGNGNGNGTGNGGEGGNGQNLDNADVGGNHGHGNDPDGCDESNPGNNNSENCNVS